LYPFITSTPTATTSPAPIETPFPYSPAGGAPGGNPSLYDVLVSVTVTVANTGERPGKEVVQLYVSYPEFVGEPPRQLRGFEKISLDVGGSTMVEFDLMRKDLSYWDVVSQNWIVANGTYGVYVGSSSRNLKLQQTVSFGL
jgi:beta-glucosidase